MSENNLVVDGKNGRIAVYSGPQSDAIEADPFTDLSKVSFHSDLDYVGFEKITKTHTVAACPRNYYVSERINLGSHGRAFSPILFAVLKGWTNGSGNPVDLPIGGGLLLDFFGQRPGDTGLFKYIAPNNFTDRWWQARSPLSRGERTGYNNGWAQRSWILGAGADESDLFVWYEQSAFNDSGANYPQVTITIDFYVGNRSIDGIGEDSPDLLIDSDSVTTTMQANGASIATGGKKTFSSDLKYLHRDEENPVTHVPSSQAVTIGRNGSLGAPYANYFGMKFAPHWDFNLRTYRQGVGSPSTPNTPDGTFIGLGF